MRNFIKELPIWSWFFVAMTLIIIFLAWQLGRAKDEQVRLAVKADSLQAVADTTRIVSAKAQKVLGDSIAGVERRSIQIQMHADALDKSLGRISAVVTNLSATIRTLTVKNNPGTAVTLNGTDTTSRQSTFHVDSTPYHVVADVKLPPPPRPGLIDLAIRIDTIHYSTRLQCGKPVDNVRPATILVTMPKWLPVTIDSSRVDVSACNSQLLKSGGLPWWTIPAAGGVGYLIKTIWK
jgi:hypothetical protein